MKLINIVNAYTAVEQMRVMEYYNGAQLVRVERELPFDYAASLVELSGKLKPQYDYFIAEEIKLTEKFAKKDGDGNLIIKGSVVQFENPEDKAGFDSARAELCNNEPEADFSGFPIKMAKPATVRCSWLEALDGFAEFV